ncbi:GAF domain-containing sensor histidine kinase [Aneurinibacillus sp. BA2021]|nr:GAF domain-containing sensor histidine kinase [Aneurinibacillus sp. BA2021]
MNKKEKALWIGASFFMPILLSVIFAVTANLLHFKQLISFFSWPFAVFFLLFPLFFFLLFQWRYKRWKRDVLTLKDSGKVHASLRRILNEYILYSLVSFLSLAFFFSSRALGEKDDHLLIFLICMGVMMTVYAPFYFGMLVRMYRYLYRIGFPVAFEKTGWNQSAATAVVLVVVGVFITTTFFVYVISQTIGSDITLYDVWQRAVVVAIVVGIPLVMLFFMIRQFYFQQLKHKQSQLHSIHLLLEKLYGNLDLTDSFLEDVVETVGQVIGSSETILSLIEDGKERQIVCMQPYGRQSAAWSASEEFSILEVPIYIESGVAGRFYLHNKMGALQFTKEDEEMMQSFSRAFSVALQNSHYIKELKKERKIAQEAANLKSNILSTMSHELRTPLNSIIGYSDIVVTVLEGSIPDKQLTNIKRIKESGKHLLGVINDILDLSKMEAGRMSAVSEPVQLRALLQFCIHNAESLRAAKPIDLMITGEQDIWIQSDEQKLKQIIMNLVSNAIKFTEEGSVIIHVERQENDVVITVEDTGIGIPPEHCETIFQPFQQIDGSLARRYKGTGLGLSIVARLVSLLGGTIRVESQAGCGSRFIVHLCNVFYEQQKKSREEV